MGKRFKPDHILAAMRRLTPPGCIPVLLDTLPEIGEAGKPYRVLPFGEMKTSKGTFTVDHESADSILARFNSEGNDLLIDYEHRVFTSEPPVPAAGWITDLTVDDDGINAAPEWTPKAQELIDNREYRYHSPVIIVRKEDRKVIALRADALTHFPATYQSSEVLNSLNRILLNQEVHMNEELFKQLIWFLQLPVTSTEADVVVELEKLLAQLKGSASTADTDEEKAELSRYLQIAESMLTHHKNMITALSDRDGNTDGLVSLSEIAALVNLSDGASLADVKGRVMSLNNQTGQVSLAEHIALKEKVEGRDADDLIKLALSEGKITAAQTAYHHKQALADPAAFKVFLAESPVVVPVNKRPDYTPPSRDEGVVANDLQIELNEQFGIDPETFKKYGPKVVEEA